MLYQTCPSCGFFLGNLLKKFEDEKEKICNDPKLNTYQVEEKIQKLIMSLKLRRYCCRMRFMTYKDLVQDIITPINESI